MLSVFARVKDPADLAYVRDEVLKTFAAMRGRRADPTRIADIKSALKYGFAARLDKSDAVAAAIVPVVAATRDVETLNAIYKRYDAVTPGEVQRVAKRYFTDDGLVRDDARARRASVSGTRGEGIS